jgi:hypothetical protein
VPFWILVHKPWLLNGCRPSVLPETANDKPAGNFLTDQPFSPPTELIAQRYEQGQRTTEICSYCPNDRRHFKSVSSPPEIAVFSFRM